jgi:pyrroloquinoline quinone biosynthesis protein B
VVLTGGEVDTIAGLLSLRESHAFTLYAAPPVLGVLRDNPIFNVLNPALVPRRAMMPGERVALSDAAGEPLGLTVEAFAVPGKVPLFNEAPEGDDPGRSDEGETIGLALSAGGAELAFVPGCAALPPALKQRLARAHTLLFDGTLFRDDEMIRAGVGRKTGARMGHMSLDGPAGTLATLDGIATRRILIHVNNTNPVLLSDSPERAVVERAGWEVAEDGMEIVLP